MLRKNSVLSIAFQVLILVFTALFSINSSWAADLEISIGTDKGRLLSGLNVYTYTEAGSYTGLNASTDSNGIATFDSDDFTAGSYKFRADYLGNQFWSQVITVPDTLAVSVNIQEEAAEITAASASGPVQGVNIYLFSGAGSYLGLNEATDSDGKTAFDLPVGEEFRFRADIMGSQYWSDPVVIQSGSTNYINIDTGGGDLQVSVEKSTEEPMEGINCYLFTASGSYLGQTQTTSSDGLVQYSVPEGDYKVRADYLGSQFWTSDITVTQDTSTILTIPHQDITITVNGTYQSASDPIEGINIYLFTSSGSYMGRTQATDSNGRVTFNLPEQAYKVRADYMGQQFWSDDFTWEDTTVNIPMADAEITVTGSGLPLESVNVYVFTGAGSYLGVNGATDTNGIITFRLPAGTYDFRADYQASQYWADDAVLLADQANTVAISTGGGIFELTVLKDVSDPLAGVNCYAFTGTGTYLGMTDTTDANGLVSFSLADGTYKFRVDYLGNQFWTDLYEIPDELTGELTIPHQDVTITINGTYQSDSDPIEGINVYLFTSSGSYMSQTLATDSSGRVTFNLPEQAYKVRADYMGQQFWSDDFTWEDTTVNIPMADAEITVTGSGLPLESVNVYVFTGAGSYLGVNGATDTNGIITFRLPAGTYDFRADYQASQYWAEDAVLAADQTNLVTISTGGGIFELTVLKDVSDPLAGVNCYSFTGTGTYLGMTDTTDSNGFVSFSLADGTYKFRVDYLGNQFWTDVYEIPDELSGELTIPHQDVIITVNGTYQSTSDPIEGINVYLFTSSGSYMSQTLATDSSGQVTFNLPEQAYKVRADYLGQQFWSDDFTWIDTTISIPHGLAHIHVTRSGTDLEGAIVYLFTETQSYLSRNETTGTEGIVEFLIPEGTYTFRADEGGDQRWSNVTTVSADSVTSLEMEMEDLPPTVTISAEPETIESGTTTAITWSSANADSVTIEPDIGSVALSGTTSVSPTETTTYTITATGPYGTATDSVTVTVTYTAPTVNISANPEIIPEGGSSTLTWISTDADSVSIDQGIGAVELSGSTTVSPTETATYTITATGPGGTVTDSAAVTINQAPAIAILEPDGIDDISEGSFTIQWTDEDPDSGATISLYYDTDNTGIDGTLIIEGLSEDDDGSGSDEYVWDTSLLDIGDYYVYALIYDGINDPVVVYSSGFVTIEQTLPDEIKLTSSDILSYDLFGKSVSISGDYAIVGASYGFSDTADYPGVAYIFKYNGSDWVEQAKLFGSDAIDGNEFGRAVYINGDFAVVGAPAPSSWYGDGPGAVYIFKRDGEIWTEQTKLIGSNSYDGDEFGCSVGISGDYVIVGARFESDGVNYPGSIYIFKRDGNSWNEQARLISSDAGSDDEFGISVSIDGDYAIVGARDAYSDTLDQTGAAYIFKRDVDTDTWTEQAKLNGSDTVDGDEFGRAVSISGEYIIVGARWGDAGSVDDAGVAYIFKRNGDTWIEQTKLSASNASEYANFGKAVEIDGDYAVVGARWGDSQSVLESGVAYVFKHEEDDWIEHIILSASDANYWDDFGDSVSIDGRYVIVGAPSTWGDGLGAAYIYQIPGYAPLPEVDISANPNSTLSGEPVTLTWTSLNADSVSIDQGIGSVELNGSITVYPTETTTYTITASGPGGVATETVTITVDQLPALIFLEPNVDSDAADKFFNIRWIDDDPESNATISIYYDSDNTGADGILLLTGVLEDDEGPDDEFIWEISELAEGSYYIYAIIDDGINDPVVVYSEGPIVVDHTDSVGELKLTVDGIEEYSAYGCSVSIDDNYAIVGAKNAYDEIGAAFIFRFNGLEWIQETELSSGVTEGSPFFGNSVSISGDLAIVGAFNETGPEGEIGAAYIYRLDGVDWILENKIFANEPEDGASFGISVSIDGDYAIVGASGANDNEGKAYIYYFNGQEWAFHTGLINTPGYLGEPQFGDAVSINGNHAIVGAFKDDIDDELEYGSASIYRLEGDEWILQAKLYPDSVLGKKDFGYSVDIFEDYAIVGAIDQSGFNSHDIGSAYVYHFDGEAWILQSELIANDASYFDGFGFSVSIDGDYAIVGAIEADSESKENTGAAYIYKREGNEWAQQQKITASDTGDGSAFGRSVCISGKYALVSASWNYTDNTSTVYFYTIDEYSGKPFIIITDPDGTNLLGQQDVADGFYKIKWIDSDYHENATISLYYDNNDYGLDGTLITSGLNEDSDEYKDDVFIWDTSGIPDGSYYLYALIEDGINTPVTDYSSGTVSIDHTFFCEARITTEDAEEDDRFGKSVSIGGEYAIVGAYENDDNGTDAGSAYIYKRSGSAWSEQVKLIASDAAENDQFGRSLAIDSNYAFVGSPNDDNYTGAVYIFKKDDTGWVEETKLTAIDATEYDHFGYAIDSEDDYLIVAAIGDDDIATASGAVYIFKNEGLNWTQVAKIKASDAQSIDYFGRSIAISGDRIVVGAPNEDDIASNSGAAYIFKREGETWIEQAKIKATSPYSSEYFGNSVSIHNNTVVVGADNGYVSGVGRSGEAYIFEWNGSNWNSKGQVPIAGAEEYDDIGTKVSVSGDYVLVSAPKDYDEYVYTRTGAIYIYKRSGNNWNYLTKLKPRYAIDSPWTNDLGLSLAMDNGYIIAGSTDYIDKNTYYNIHGAAYIYKIMDTTIYSDSETIVGGDSATLYWSSQFIDSVTIDQGIGDVDLTGSITVSPTETTTYTITGEAGGVIVSDSTTVTVIYPPEITILEPQEDVFTNYQDILISWEDSDPDDNATISLYYDTDSSGDDGILIAEGISEDPDDSSDTYTWDITGIPDGTYYVYAIISDGVVSVSDYSTGSITIDRISPTVYATPTEGPYTSTQSVTLAADETADIYYTIDGTDPTDASFYYTAPIEISETTMLKFFAVDLAGNQSEISSEYYRIYSDTDLDSDTLPDDWEMLYFSSIDDCNPNVDSDGDGLTNYQEYLLGTDPTEYNPDNDEDGLPDWWELEYFGDLSHEPDVDDDSDGYSNYIEGKTGTDPTDPDHRPATDDDIDLGINSDEQQGGGGVIGETVRILNGNVIDYRTDLSFTTPNQLGLSLSAVYNSRSSLTGSMGYGWTHTYEASLDPSFEMNGIFYLKIIDNTGKASYFRQHMSETYEGVFGEYSHVVDTGTEYVWYRLDGTQYGFNGSGQISWMEDTAGNRISLSYGAYGVSTVTDSASGRTMTFNYNTDGLLEYIVGPATDTVTDGIWASYAYDADQNLISVTYADGSGFEYYYEDLNDIHNLTKKTDKAGHILNTWAYDDQDRIETNFSRDGRGVDIIYATKYSVSVTDAYGKEREYSLEEVYGRLRVSSITCSIGSAGAMPYTSSNAVSWTYDEEMRPMEIGYAGGSITQYGDYDQRGNPGTVALAFGTDDERTIYYTYHPDMNVPLTRTEPSLLGGGNKETIWDYDDDGNIISNENPTGLVYRIIEKGFTRDDSGIVVDYEYITSFSYNDKGQVLYIDGPLPGTDDRTTFIYDSDTGDLYTLTRPLIGETNFTDLDETGQAGMMIDVNNQITTYTFDGRGRVTTTTNQADSSTSHMDFNISGLIESTMDEDGVTSDFEYDATYGRLSRRIDYDGNYISYIYDDQGNVTEKGYYDALSTLTNQKRFSFQDGTGNTTHTMPGLLYREINPDDTYTEYTYDPEGNVSSVKDPRDYTTYYAYDSLNRLTMVIQPASVVTLYTYDAHGNLETVTDANSNTTTYEYDDMGRVVTNTSPDTGTVTYAYDEAGNPVNKTDANYISVDYVYDALNRLTNVNFPDSSENITYSYDEGTNGIGRRTGMTDQSGNVVFEYDDRGRLATKISTISGHLYTLSRTFTPGSRVSSMTYPSGRSLDYTRSGCPCNITGVYTTFDDETTTLMEDVSYRPFGTATSVQSWISSRIENVHDSMGRLEVSNPDAQTETIYDYDANSNLISVQATNNSAANRMYSYDPLNMLVYTEGSYGTIEYTYDDVGNRNTKTDDGDTDTYSYVPGSNRLDEISTDTETITYTYDNNGNIIQIDDMVLTYNQRNRLALVEKDGSTLGEYTYNGLGQRITKTAYGFAETIFHYDFDGNIIGESEPSGKFIKEYLYMGDNRLAMVEVPDEKLYFFVNDNLGTPQALTDPDGNAVWEATYKPFGKAYVNPSSSIINNFRFPGQYFDSETGLHYNYHRYYEPSTGRYLRADPIGLLGGVNLYSYVSNNPINFIDPLGLDRLIFSDNTIIWQTDSGYPLREFSGISGPHGKGRLDPGVYSGHNLRLRDDKPGFMCENGFGFSLDLDPTFDTERTLLRLHPDGNIEGTLGCIGVNCVDAMGLYHSIKTYFDDGHSSIDVHVLSPGTPLPR